MHLIDSNPIRSPHLLSLRFWRFNTCNTCVWIPENNASQSNCCLETKIRGFSVGNWNKSLLFLESTPLCEGTGMIDTSKLRFWNKRMEISSERLITVPHAPRRLFCLVVWNDFLCGGMNLPGIIQPFQVPLQALPAQFRNVLYWYLQQLSIWNGHQRLTSCFSKKKQNKCWLCWWWLQESQMEVLGILKLSFTDYPKNFSSWSSSSPSHCPLNCEDESWLYGRFSPLYNIKCDSCRQLYFNTF